MHEWRPATGVARKIAAPTKAPVTQAAATQLQIFRADYHQAAHASALVDLLDAYARDPAGGGQPLSDFAKTHLVQALAARPHAFSVLAFDGAQPVGLVNCIEGFSTFACRPLVNVHDVVVLASHRGRRVGEQMQVGAALVQIGVLASVEQGGCAEIDGNAQGGHPHNREAGNCGRLLQAVKRFPKQCA